MPKQKNLKHRKGFTIIEVVLVLAIAGLIFLMVFIAFPALQRGQRDTQRRDDMARFASQLAQYQSNNYGKVPGMGATEDSAKVTSWNNFINDYLRSNGDTFADPSGVDYHVQSSAGTYEGDTSDSISTTAIQICSLTDCPTGGSADKNNSAKDNPANAIIRIYTNATCSGENPEYKKGDKYIAFTYRLESAGIYCGHN